MLQKILFKNLLIFSDGSFCLNFSSLHNLKKIIYTTDDFKKNQKKLKKKSITAITDLNATTNYRKKLFK
jgi:hypothetical protein